MVPERIASLSLLATGPRYDILDRLLLLCTDYHRFFRLLEHGLSMTLHPRSLGPPLATLTVKPYVQNIQYRRIL